MEEPGKTTRRARHLQMQVLDMHGGPRPGFFHRIAAMTSSAPYTVRLDAESARELAQRGGTVLLLDVPEGSAIGVDQQASCSEDARNEAPSETGLPMLPPPPLPPAPQRSATPCPLGTALWHCPADLPGGSQVQGRQDGAARHPPGVVQRLERARRLWAHHQLLPDPQGWPGEPPRRLAPRTACASAVAQPVPLDLACPVLTGACCSP